MCSTDLFLGLLAILFPPLPVWVKCGICSADSIINILLCMLGYLPGLFHSWYIIAKYPEPIYGYEHLAQDSEGGHREVYIVVASDDPRIAPAQRQQAPKPQNNMSYGATDSYGGASQSQQQQQQRPAQQPQPQHHGDDAGEGRSEGASPPSYAQVVAGDNKVQNSQD